MNNVIDVLNGNDGFVIAGHRDPDGDSLGSSLALALALEQLDKRTCVLSADPLFAAYSRLQETERIIVGPRAPDGFPVAVIMECNGIERTGISGLDDRLVVNIDHHANNPNFGAVNWVDPTAAAVGVMIYRLLLAMDLEITPTIATHLYVAILTDTGSFRYSNTDAESFRVAADLVDKGVEPAVVAEAMYGNVAADKLRLLAAGLSSLQLEQGGAVATMVLHHDTLAASPGKPDTEGIVNQGKSIEGVSVAVLFKEAEPDSYRVSLRSDERVDVADLVAAFGGGGHPRASGCSVEGNIEQAREQVLGAVRTRLADSEGRR